MKRLILLVVFLTLARASFSQNQDQNPGSLWPSHYVNPLTDRTAKAEGDIVTIIISETSTASFAATTSTTRAEDSSIGNINVPVITGLFKALGISNSSSYKGDGSTTQTGNLTARITATVTKALPNGNLVIEGKRWIKVNKDTQIITLTGTIRRDDIRADNTILSENIANAEIKTDGTGQISKAQKRGFLSKILEWLF